MRDPIRILVALRCALQSAARRDSITGSARHAPKGSRLLRRRCTLGVWPWMVIWAMAHFTAPARAADDPWAELILSAAQAQAVAAGDRLQVRSLRLPARLPAVPDPEQTRVEFRRDEDFCGPTVVGLVSGGRRAWARVDFARTETVMVAARDLPAGTVLSAADLKELSLPRDGAPTPRVLRAEDALGRILRAPLRAGEPLRADRLERPQAVRAGQRVVIEARVGAVRLRAAGQALAAGRVGDSIGLLNLQSGRRVVGRVVDAGRVVVDAESAGGEP